MEKPTYSLSYSSDRGTPNWVSWHLTSEWYGSLARVDTFRPDPKVDPSWYRVQAFDYAGSGFDRGHMTPNADRDNQNRIPINQETYLMTNMVPQSLVITRDLGPTSRLICERKQMPGRRSILCPDPTVSAASAARAAALSRRIANGHVTVPSETWKVALFLPQATGDDIARVNCSTRTLAVIMPNIQDISSDVARTTLRRWMRSKL